MNAILIKADSKANKKLYKLAKELGGKVINVSKDQYEDFCLGLLMDKHKTNVNIERSEIVKKLKT